MEFKINRADVMRRLLFHAGVSAFDQLVEDQGGGPDLVYPSGWTETDSIAMYRSQPVLHQWLMRCGLIPKDNVAAKFPPVAYQALYSNFPDGWPGAGFR